MATIPRYFRDEEENESIPDVFSEIDDSEHPEDEGNSSVDQNSSTQNEQQPIAEERPALAQKETRAVNRSKLLVYAILFMTGAAASVGTYFFVKDTENSDFEQRFNNNALELLRSSQENSKKIFGDVIKISNDITSFAKATNASLPFVTLPDFEIMTSEPFDSTVGAELILFAPRVPKNEKKRFEEYAQRNQGWIEQDLMQRQETVINPGSISKKVYFVSQDDDVETDFSAPLWQVSPAPSNASIIMKDLYSQASFRRMIDDVLIEGKFLLSEVVDQESLDKETTGVTWNRRGDQPSSYAVQPVFDSLLRNQSSNDHSDSIVGFLFAVIPWDTYFWNILSTSALGVVVEIEDTCGSSFSYLIEGPRVSYLGQGSGETSETFRELKHSQDFAEFARFTGTSGLDYLQFCNYRLSVYPTEEYKNQFMSDDPVVFAIAIMSIFLFTSIAFALYDFLVTRRQNKVAAVAEKTTAIVASMFPKNVQDRIFEEAQEKAKLNDYSSQRFGFGHKTKLKAFLKDGDDNQEFKSQPIADFFPMVTIMFADIVGFTAWSSTREPSQVFMLLESIFSEFDKIAKRNGVYKVETVGDCYVAVCGLPDYNDRHATVMARFASQCTFALDKLLHKLEVSLGPDTTELGIRVGLHSGPVTAGVLRGERSRFQLFGDSMNTASRMESTGKKGEIQVSSATYNLLKEANKEHWLTPREDRVVAKGKGELTTWWLTKGKAVSSGGAPTHISGSNESQDPAALNNNDDSKPTTEILEKDMRLVQWNKETLLPILQAIAAMREAQGSTSDSYSHLFELEQHSLQRDSMVLEEVCDLIPLPAYDSHAASQARDPKSIEIDEIVADELIQYLTHISLLYRKNPFHNFEHASHVTMSVVKLFARIVAPEQQEADSEETLHDHTYGITSDPLTRFAVVLGALIHDVDHQGVPNTQLIKEETALAAAYRNKSVAEQNSFDIAWNLLMRDQFQSLRQAIYHNADEFMRFRKLLVNIVLATDIMDKDLKALRNSRWEKAFAEPTLQEQPPERPIVNLKESVDRKATIVLEHLIQASDVAHTMQHWHVFRKWNERLFLEMHQAYKNGKAEKDPSEFWYKGEMGFFDFYIIPLAKKLKDCGVFGVSSDEYLSYAEANRREWEDKGEQLVAEMLERINGGTLSRIN